MKIWQQQQNKHNSNDKKRSLEARLATNMQKKVEFHINIENLETE